jgi:hypothetical protein
MASIGDPLGWLETREVNELAATTAEALLGPLNNTKV